MSKKKANKKTEEELPGAWKGIQAAIWMIGIAVLALTDWWWPGILVLVAISGVTESVLRMRISRVEEEKAQAAAEQQLVEERDLALPPECPNCGAPTTADNVEWTGRRTATCTYCGTTLKAVSQAEKSDGTTEQSSASER